MAAQHFMVLTPTTQGATDETAGPSNLNSVWCLVAGGSGCWHSAADHETVAKSTHSHAHADGSEKRFTLSRLKWHSDRDAPVSGALLF